MLEDNDLKCLEENTGETFAHSKNKLTRLSSVSNSSSPPAQGASQWSSLLTNDLTVSTGYP